jgi:hypothetical protein
VRADTGESWVIRAAGLAQIGDYDEARTALAHVNATTESHPFAKSVHALIAALQRCGDEAIEAATAVSDAVGHTYLDGVVASVSAGASAADHGDEPMATLWLERAVELASATQDKVATALALYAYAHVLGSPHPNGEGDVGALGNGWRAVVQALPELREVLA